jgi:hypothetical protein
MTDDHIRAALRPIRGCATDQQYQDVIANVEALEKRLLEVLRVGREMRLAQDRYFKGRTQRNLLAAKHLEAEFDRLAADALGIAPLLLP